MNPPVHILKIGGNVQEDDALLQQVLSDFAQLPGTNLLVHGGGKRATAIATRLGIPSQIVNGRRITDAATLEVALMVYGGLMNKRLVSRLQGLGLNAVGLTGADLDVVRAVKRPVAEIDFGYVGDIIRVDGERLDFLLSHGITPVMASLSHDGNGQMLNTNADSIASHVAQALATFRPVHLIYCFEKAGVLLDVNDDASLVQRMSHADMIRMQDQGLIADGMLPKLSNAFSAVEAGVSQVWICHAEAISKLGTAEMVGTRIV